MAPGGGGGGGEWGVWGWYRWPTIQTMISTAGLGGLPPAASLANMPLIGQGATFGHQKGRKWSPGDSGGGPSGGRICGGWQRMQRVASRGAHASSGEHLRFAQRGRGSPVPALTSDPGVYVGEGAAPVPKKLADKILRWEFVEIGELLPEFWLCARDDTKSRSRRLLT